MSKSLLLAEAGSLLLSENPGTAGLMAKASVLILCAPENNLQNRNGKDSDAEIHA